MKLVNWMSETKFCHNLQDAYKAQFSTEFGSGQVYLKTKTKQKNKPEFICLLMIIYTFIYLGTI